MSGLRETSSNGERQRFNHPLIRPRDAIETQQCNPVPQTTRIQGLTPNPNAIETLGNERTQK